MLSKPFVSSRKVFSQEVGSVLAETSTVVSLEHNSLQDKSGTRASAAACGETFGDSYLVLSIPFSNDSEIKEVAFYHEEEEA